MCDCALLSTVQTSWNDSVKVDCLMFHFKIQGSIRGRRKIGKDLTAKRHQVDASDDDKDAHDYCNHFTALCH